MGSRDRPHKEVKKKPKDKSSQPSLSPLSEPPPAGGGHPEAAQATVGRAGVQRGLRRRADGDRVPLRRVGSSRTERGLDDDHRQGDGHPQRRDREGRRGARAGGRRRHPRDREAVRPRLDHEARLDGAPGRSTRSPRARSRSTSRSASAASRAAGSPRSSDPSRRARPRSASTSSPRRSSAGGIAAFIDVEHALDPGYARACGVNVDELLRQPARHRRAGARDHRDPDPLRRRRHRRPGLRGGPRAARRDRGRDGRQLRGHPGPAHEPGAAQAHRRASAAPTPRSCSPTSCARRSASCSATPRRRPAAARSSSTPRSASTSGASRRSRPAPSRSATGSASRSSRTRSRRRSGSPSSTSCTARASPAKAGCWTSAWRWTS